MEDNKDPKWTATEAINSGKTSLRLLETHGTALQSRLRTDEQQQHKANVEELETRVMGQKQTLTAQMSNTQAQEKAIHDLNDTIISIHDVVRKNNASKEITVAYGVGERISQSVIGVTAAANVVIDAHLKYGAWSKDAGIIEADITEVKDLIKAVNDVGKVQGDSKFVRKAKTMDKNTLQREVEDEVSRLSVLGARHFGKNPTVRKQFEDLIPAAHKPKPATPATQTTNEKNGASK
jgi:hypothetical protein